MTAATTLAKVERSGRYYRVVYKGVEFARFKPQEDSNATDFCNGFNAGLIARGRPAS